MSAIATIEKLFGFPKKWNIRLCNGKNFPEKFKKYTYLFHINFKEISVNHVQLMQKYQRPWSQNEFSISMDPAFFQKVRSKKFL